ncbi:putative mitochondrial ABC transporter [Leptomonas pyrrhocoris]|uniref:Putative mitochondrial ABC transporter n=1 Tax=Leptomonas pyrrhocoris TaxID=157538 RepID=A0A0M9FTJ5_LEPPY|nr:putative mitochondrial ABC transporter [Leptomonas pyrrhocoris]KPA75677.1 putative mitochondrial ABC transporter [Leptomonas pyrrhocoris]|eukprot:XP_015654116.1 putative mitochondrial ABC transporter [Leptomonas pyrrhocoris]
MSSVDPTTPAPPPHVPSTASFHWGPTFLLGDSLHSYRAAIGYVARVWTPPAALDGVEYASFVVLLSSGLCVMEGFHAVRYTLRQLRRFKAETAPQHPTRVVCGDGHAALPFHTDAPGGETTEVNTKSRELLEAADDKDEERAAAATTTTTTVAAAADPFRWYQRVLHRISAALPTRAGKQSAPHIDESEDEAAAADSNPLGRPDNESSEYDFMSRGTSVPFEMSNLPAQRGGSLLPYATADGAATVSLHDAGDAEDGDAEDEEEDQTWEATPEMLMHYWKQLEHIILTAPRRNARRFFRNLPNEMTATEPDVAAVNAWFDGVTHHLQGGASVWSYFASAAALHTPPTEVKKESSLAAPACAPFGQQRPAFAVPPNGCFAYHTKPPPEDFYRDTDHSSGEEEELCETHQQQQTPQQEDKHEEQGEPPHPRGPSAEEEEKKRESEASAAGTTADVEAAAPVAGRGTVDGSEAASRARPRRHILHWEALLLIWFNVTEVPMSSREIRALLLKASPPAVMSPAMVRDSGPTAFNLASTNLSLLWFWSTLQRVFETLVLNEDVERCEADIEELQAYAMPLFIKCVARWPVPAQMSVTMEVALHRGLVGFICVVQSTWMALNVVMQRLLGLRRRLYYRNTWSLARYMYSSSKAKVMSAALITVMMTLSSRVSAAGRVVRERIAGYIENGTEEGHVSAGVGKGSGGGSGPAMNLRLMLALCAFELARMAVQYVITNTTSEFIVLTASQRREVVKMQLYEALSHTQLTFYEQHTYEEVEEILYYVNDMEGIDVQLHQYLFDAINVFVELTNALRPFTYRSTVVAAGVAMAPYALRGIAAAVERRYLLAQREGYLPSGAYAVEDAYQGAGDGDGGDDANVLREGAMLRGDEIIAAIPQLRPYGADVRLVRWWNRHQQRRQHMKLSRHRPPSSTAKETKKAAAGGEKECGSSVKSGLRREGAPTSANGRRSAPGSQSRQGWRTYFQSLIGAWVTDEDIGLVRSALVALVQLPHGKLLPGSGKALLDLSEWLLPMAASAYGIAWCGQPNLDPFQLLQGMQAIEAAVDNIGEARDTAEMIGYNAYKASMLERLLQPTQWEVVSREESLYMANFIISAAEVGRVNDARQRWVAQSHRLSRLVTPASATPSATPLLSAAMAGAASFYRRHALRHIEIEGIRLRYVPTESTVRRRRRRNSSTHDGTPHSGTPVSASLPNGDEGGSVEGQRTAEDETDDDEHAGVGRRDAPHDGAPLFSADIVLWSPQQQRGRFVCVTGPNGRGKTALVNLLLALYVNARGPLPSSVASSPHAGRLGSGAVTFCFAGRIRARRQRRGGLTSRTANSSQVNVARAGSSAYGSFHSHRGAATAAASADGGRRGESRVDLRTIPADVLRRHIFSYVPEMPTVFSGATVAQNISLAGYVSVATDALMRRVTQCATLAQCDFVQRLPLGLLTRIADTTANSWGTTAGQYSTGVGNTSVTRLSADQAKRLMLARAYFHGGEVLLMDEPTKEMEDPATARRMCEGWCKLLERGHCSGVICMTMDETLLRMADEVITLP